LTLNYWKFAHDLVPGDVVFDQHGKPVTITLTQTYRSAYCYEVLLNDYLTICGDIRLSLPLEDRRYRCRSDNYKGRHQFRRPLLVKSVEEILTTPLVDYRNRKAYSVPTTAPIQLPHQTLPVPPFIFGFWFFNRRSNGNLIPSPGNRDFILEKFQDHGYLVTEKDLTDLGERNFVTKPTVVSHLVPNIPTKIPNNYLLGSAEQRFELLQGILYAKSRAFNKTSQQFRFSSKSKPYVTQVQYLAESLGCKTKVIDQPNGLYYTVFIKTKLQFHPNQRVNPNARHIARRFVTQITKLPDQLCVHIETDGSDQTILVGEGFIPCL
jgi:hypothetical protein